MGASQPLSGLPVTSSGQLIYGMGLFSWDPQSQIVQTAVIREGYIIAPALDVTALLIEHDPSTVLDNLGHAHQWPVPVCDLRFGIRLPSANR